MAGASGKLLLLVMMSSLVGCQSIQTTLTGETEAAERAAEELRKQTCEAWKPVTYSSRDTPETQLEARANNAARDVYCASGE